MQIRSSHVKDIRVKSMLLGAVMEVGDSVHLSAHSNVIAIQREKEIFYGNEGNFQEIPLFTEPIPLPTPPFMPPIIHKVNEIPNITVNCISIIGISASAIFHIGNTDHVSLESRIWHQRQLEERTNSVHKE
ncbi:spore germination protein GerPE [Bacillus sp. FJAT-50079]|uniref:spore germination protein GerPE n=1 Tax=Bacillus sp. FJAT-50079 TaxID=2833577 RepID=UPI001BC9D90F|nr:spore germination protein GerPE [Bacillus sp. FJAT-50079]MBS4210666.1 spore germination protein GerPE [Bacillus sp. FJAT-50079]